MATTNRKPATAFRCGNVNAAVWENTGEKGIYFSVTFSRPYKDAQGNWKNSASYGLNDLDALSSVAEMAKDWVRGTITVITFAYNQRPLAIFAGGFLNLTEYLQ